MVNLYYSLIAVQFICSGPCVPHRIKQQQGNSVKENRKTKVAIFW